MCKIMFRFSTTIAFNAFSFRNLHLLSASQLAVDGGDFVALVLLELSGEFDTVDHEILILQRPQRSINV